MPATATRPRISEEFLLRNTCDRIIAGAAEAIAAAGYRATIVADIVRASRMARNTFYDCYSSKEDAARALVLAVGLDLESVSEAPAVDVLAIEIAAMHYAGEVERAEEHLLQAEKLVRFVAECETTPLPAEDHPLQGALPPGKHLLPSKFVRANHRTRLLTGTAATVVNRGFMATRISDIVEHACISRRTFYEYCRSVDDAAMAMVAAACSRDGSPPADITPDSGLGVVAIEIIAGRLVDAATRPPVADQALAAIDALTTVFQEAS